MIPTSFVFWTLRIRFTHKLSRSLQRGASSSFHSSGLGRSDMAQHHAIRNLGLGQALILGVSHSLAFSQNAASIAYAVRHSERVSYLILYGGFAAWAKRPNSAGL
jgi:hypothetical protein